MSPLARRLQQVSKMTPFIPPASNITHGDQLTISDVGPWALQAVARGSESLDVVALPVRGYWRADTPLEFVPNQPYVYSNSPANKGGIVPAGGLTIDGYFVPAGTYVCQFRDLSAGDFACQGLTSGTLLFRGVRVRNGTTGDSATFNIATSTAGFTIHTHYSDFGANDGNTPHGAFIKMIGGGAHRVLRTYFTYLSTAIQPNVNGMEITENYIDKITYFYGEAGTSGLGPDSTTGHLNGISTEGGLSGLTIQRNRIVVPSPDEGTAAGGAAAGQPSYGTQPGQLGNGAGSNPGRLTTQTDCIALFTLGGNNSNIQILDNYLGGAGWCFYGTASGGINNVYTGNKVTTKWWSNGGNYGPYNGTVAFGSGGNVSSGNVWADDYGTGGNGTTALSGRQYPAGNGPRAGTVVF